MTIDVSNILLYASVFFIISAVLVIVYFGFISKRFKDMFSGSDSKTLNEFSQFVSSISGPLFAIGGSLIIYSTIIEQNKSNDIQDYRDEVNHFETIYFKNIEYHRDNNKFMSVVSPYTWKIKEGRSAFVNINLVLRDVVQVIKKRPNTLNDEDIADIAFQLYFIGIDNPTARNILNPMFKKYSNKVNIDTLLMDCDTITHHDSISHFLFGQKSRMSSYFEQFTNTLKLLDRFATKVNMNQEDKEFYANLLLQHNGHYEKSVMYFYLFSDSADETIKRLAKKYIKPSKNDLIELSSMLQKKNTND
jgi:hypothetical protein